jgi:tyrosine-protein phosphatase SIW14
MLTLSFQHRTGCVVAAIRKYYRWNLDCVLDEYRTYAEPKVRDCDLEYISSFDHLQLADLWGKDYHRRADEPPPRRPLIRRDERASFQYRFRRFYRTALFTLAMVLVWIYSGNSMILANSAAGPRPTG